MKRDMDLIRRIAIATADLQPNTQLSELEGIDIHTFAAHVEWMRDAGLIDARVAGGYPDPIVSVLRLTWAGCEFVDSARDEATWRKVMSKVLGTGASFTFDLLKEALKTEISKRLSSLL